ncbi:MAG: DUF1573 domain-containing protein [Rikenellaceae bacterium]|nr:DUF1573 domain-containing protein [Rikenellaceae bacterium]
MEYPFLHTGAEPVIIQSVETSCGCTVARWPTHPILPGIQEKITIHYTGEVPGVFHKRVFIRTSEQKLITLTIRGNILE